MLVLGVCLGGLSWGFCSLSLGWWASWSAGTYHGGRGSLECRLVISEPSERVSCTSR
jgi:hypothetical protein